VRVLVVGATGMMGHRLLRRLEKEAEAWGTVRRVPPAVMDDVTAAHLIPGIHADDPESLTRAFDSARPDVVVNCAGVTSHRPQPDRLAGALEANAVLPHRLADLCAQRGSRLLHLSTDCVFSGRRGRYREDDPPDPVDQYGRGKLLGEVRRPGCLTLRTSMIGWQLRGLRGLAEWFAEHRHQGLRGYRRAVFSGLTTAALSEILTQLALEGTPSEGLFHVAAEPIDKHALLSRLAAALEWRTSIEPVDEPVIDRSLDASAFRAATGWTPPDWDEMLRGLADERPTYEEWRSR
jgi:dTDP-4-dehydrorhamnose reductase